MYPTVYLALLSALKSRDNLPRYCASMLEGDFARAYCVVDDVADQSERVQLQARGQSNHELTALADVSVVVGDFEAAENHYRRAQKLTWKEDDQLRVQSCRNTAWVSLFRARPAVAQRGFARVCAESEAYLEQRIEAYIGMALAHHQLAQQQAADDALLRAAKLADEHEEPRFRLVADLLAQEFDVRLRVRASRALDDHAFWQSSLISVSLAAGSRVPLEPASAVAVRPALLSLHQELLHSMERLASGECGTPASVIARRISRLAPNRDFEFHALLEMALAAFAGGGADLGVEIMGALAALDGQAHRNVDYFYSMAKVATRRGEHVQALKFYCQYTAEALRCLRSDAAPIRAAGTARTHGTAPVNDDVSARLPAKYRRAYRYIIDNIDREDLTTREVAAEMNVTMRTIQLVFKRALGVTPCGLIRSLRLEGIRRDLLDENGPASSIHDTANRWGLKSRSTLAKGYRKHFNESPSQTIIACTP
jgi:AraC-like DNA-binding protein